MTCTRPHTVGFRPDGRITYSMKSRDKQFAVIKLPCGKCIACRLAYAREWAVRCTHEAQMHPEGSSFLTLTYDDDHLKDPRLNYEHFQKFVRALRKRQNDPLSYIVAGEYGETTKRPHWHAIMFGYNPSDQKHFRKTKLGHDVFSSESLTQVWGKGTAEIGAVTLQSAGYVARYSAKKLAHGDDPEGVYAPIFKTSSKRGIGKAWLETFWPDVFNYGRVVTPDGDTLPIPRYYKKWFKENRPEEWLRYIKKVQTPKTEFAVIAAHNEKAEVWNANSKRRARGQMTNVTPKNQVREQIINERLKRLKTTL